MDATSDENNFDEIKLYKYRWFILFIFCLYSFINFVQFLQYSIISNIVVKYYNVDSFLVSLTGLIFMICYLIFFLPFNYIIQSFNFKLIAIISSGLTAIGNLMKLLSVTPDRFYVVILGQFLCGIAQVFMLSIPSKLASIWFGPSEVSTACAIAVLGTQLGVATGSIIPPLLVENHSNIEDIGDDMFQMIMYNAIISSVIFIIVVLFFRSKPKLPPSHSQLIITVEGRQVPFLEALKNLIRNKDYLIILVSFGVTNGIWNALGIHLNDIYLNYFPHGESDAGLCAFLAIISGGCIGSVIFGFILDRTHKFKLISSLDIFASAISCGILVYTLISKLRVATFCTVSIFGFFVASTLVIGFEFVTEITYPLPEATSCSVLNATVFIFAIIFTLLFNYLFVSIGYLATFIGIAVILLLCCSLMYFVSSNLLRRNANIIEN